MPNVNLRPRLARTLAAAALAAGLGLALLPLAPSAQAAKAAAGFIATPNGMVGVGQTITVYGQICTIVKVYPFGTIDVVTATGRQYRVTGLSF